MSDEDPTETRAEAARRRRRERIENPFSGGAVSAELIRLRDELGYHWDSSDWKWEGERG